MRINCPHCGERDSREFSCQGAALALNRPDPNAGETAWDDYVHLRDNVAGPVHDLWYHEGGCAAWIVVNRDTTTHEITATAAAATIKRPMK